MRETTQLASEPNIKIQRPGPEKFDESLGFCPPLILSVSPTKRRFLDELTLGATAATICSED